MSKPVYVKLVECGALPDKSSKTVSFSDVMVNVVDLRTIAKRTDKGYSMTMPMVSASGAILARAVVSNEKNISIDTYDSLSSYNAYAVVKYTKD